MIPHPYSEHLSTFALAENLDRALGFPAGPESQALYGSKWLAPLIDNVILGEDASLPDLSRPDNYQLVSLLEMDIVQLRRLSKIAAVIIHGPVLLRNANGAVLRNASDFSGMKNMIETLRELPEVQMHCLPVNEGESIEALSQTAEKCCSFLVGTFPDPYLKRFAFRFIRSDLPPPIGIKPDTTEGVAFNKLTDVALAIFRDLQDAEATPS